MLERDDLDPMLRSRLEDHVEEHPLRVAERSLADDRLFKIGSITNRIVAPLAALAEGGVLDPISTIRSAIDSLLAIGELPEATPRERRALHEWEKFVARYPDAPQSAALMQKVERYREKRREGEHDEALASAQRSFRAGSPDAALLHLDRADLLDPGDEQARALRRRAREWRDRRDAALREMMASEPGRPDETGGVENLARALLLEPMDALGARASRLVEDAEAHVADEIWFVASFDESAGHDEEAFLAALREAGEQIHDGNLGRHARALHASPSRNPYKYYHDAVWDDRRDRVGWVLFAGQGFDRRYENLPHWLDALFSLPSRFSALFTAPSRVMSYPLQRERFGNRVMQSGERYLERYPRGVHANEVHEELESLYAARGDLPQALAHHEAQLEPSPRRLERYHEQVATALLAAAEEETRADVKIAMLRTVMTSHADTPQAAGARDALQTYMERLSPQRIRISREFMVEFPELRGASGLGLSESLFDGDDDNGELADEGVTLLGRSYIELALVDRSPLVLEIRPARLARFVAGVEDASYRRVVGGEREQPKADPQRDLYFERVRLGLVDKADFRPSARSDATYLGTNELQRRPRLPVLPVELVLRGSIESLSLSAFPRIRLPADEPDAFLYQ